MQEVVLALKAIISPEQNDAIICDNEKKELEEYKSNSNLSKGTTDINNDLINDMITSLNIDEYESRIVVESENNLSSVSNKATNSSLNKGTIDVNNNLINNIAS